MLEAECKQKDGLITEVSSRETKAEEVARSATKRLLSSASILDQIAGFSHANLLVVADLEASLGL